MVSVHFSSSQRKCQQPKNELTPFSSALKDRVDAVIAHEFTEVGASPVPGLSPHDQAIMFAPETELTITDGARAILREYRRLMGLE
jgi:hypothetical protein